jgi:adenylate cyclase
MAEPIPAPFLKFEDEGGREIPLVTGNVWKIGRTEDNAVVLLDDSVSRNHAMLQSDGGEFYLIDMGSRNGSFVNGRRLTAPVALRDGDRLSLGQARLCFRNPAQVAAARAAACASAVTPASGQTIALFQKANVSVLVVDIRGFTVLAQKIDAGVLSRLVSTWFAEADRITHHYGGTAQKHIGDAVMAVWMHGAQGDEPAEILRILWAVAEIARMTERLHASFGLGDPVRIGAGVNTGPAVLGNTGGGGGSDFTAIGDTVNVAFGLESATKELGTDLVLGSSAFDSLRRWPFAAAHFRTSEANLKGYDAPVRTWHISFAALSEFLAKHGEDRSTAINSALRSL